MRTEVTAEGPFTGGFTRDRAASENAWHLVCPRNVGRRADVWIG